MEKKNTLAKILGVIGTILVWLPVLAPIVFSLIRFFASQHFNFDYLMPAEFFFVVFLGGGLLLWAALVARALIKWIGWSLGVAVFMLFGSQGLAIVTGVASSPSDPSGWRFILVIAGLIIYDLAVIALGIGGILLLRRLVKKQPSETQSPVPA